MQLIASASNDRLALLSEWVLPWPASRQEIPRPASEDRAMIFTEAAIAEALIHRCDLYKAPPDAPCVNICDGEALPGRFVHLMRLGAK